MDQKINNIELNAILYYADFLSLEHTSTPITDNCKYFFIHNVPINSCYILDLEPIYDPENQYFQQAYQEYVVLRDKFGEDGVQSFVNNLANLQARGAVNAEQMLKCIHYYNTKYDKKNALKTYNKWKKSKKYTHTTINEDGQLEEHQCSMYTYHVERSLEKQGLLGRNAPHPQRFEVQTVESLL